MYILFVMVTWISFYCYLEKVFILMNTWIDGLDLMNEVIHRLKSTIASSI